MSQDHIADLFSRWSVRHFSCFQVFFDLSKDPRVSSGTTADHDTVTSGFFYKPFCGRSIHYIPVSDHRDRNCLLHLTDDIPVCTAGIILLPCPAMNRNCRHTTVLCNPRHLNSIHVCFIKALSDLHRYRLLHCLYQGRKDLCCQNRIFHQC